MILQDAFLTEHDYYEIMGLSASATQLEVEEAFKQLSGRLNLRHPIEEQRVHDAEQMLTLVEIVSAQERDIKALKEQCRRLEEHDQAIAVAFSTFFHVLSAGRVAKLGEIANILNNIIKIAEQEGRPPASIKFLQDLADMLPDDSAEKQRHRDHQ